MGEIYDVETNDFIVEIPKTKQQKVIEKLRADYPQLQLTSRSDGIIIIGDEKTTLTTEEKDAIKASVGNL